MKQTMLKRVTDYVRPCAAPGVLAQCSLLGNVPTQAESVSACLRLCRPAHTQQLSALSGTRPLR